MDIRKLFLFPSYQIIVFNGDQHYYTVKDSTVCYSQINKSANACENNFMNSRINVSNCKMLGKFTELTDEKVVKVFEEARYFDKQFPDFTNPAGEKLASPLESLRSYLMAEKWTYPLERTWIIIPKPAKKLSGKNVVSEFMIANADFTQINEKVLLPVYYNEIKADTAEVKFSVEIPDFLYDFMMLHPELELRPKSKVITSTSFAVLKSEIFAMSTHASTLTDNDRWMKNAEKVILIAFASDQKDQRDSWCFGYAGKKTTIVFNYFIGFRPPKNFMQSGKSIFVDKHYEQGKGFQKVTGRLIPVTDTNHKVMPWTQGREDFLVAIEANFKQLSDNLNNYLSDLDADKLDLLASSNVKLLQ